MMHFKSLPILVTALLALSPSASFGAPALSCDATNQAVLSTSTTSSESSSILSTSTTSIAVFSTSTISSLAVATTTSVAKALSTSSTIAKATTTAKAATTAKAITTTAKKVTTTSSAAKSKVTPPSNNNNNNNNNNNKNQQQQQSTPNFGRCSAPQIKAVGNNFQPTDLRNFNHGPASLNTTVQFICNQLQSQCRANNAALAACQAASRTVQQQPQGGRGVNNNQKAGLFNQHFPGRF